MLEPLVDSKLKGELNLFDEEIVAFNNSKNCERIELSLVNAMETEGE